MLPERLQLRPHLATMPASTDAKRLVLVDRLGLAQPLALSPQEQDLLDLLDGEHSLSYLQTQAACPTAVRQWLEKLDSGLFLDTPRFRAVADAPIRPPRCVGCYAGDPNALCRQLHGLFTHARGSGLPRPITPDGALCATLVPHIDFARGGLTYTFPFKEIAERSKATLFVIIGTSHYSSHRFSLTRKDFRTPLGVVPTDQDYIDRLVREFGAGLFDDEWLAHFPEHSIELEVVFLQYLFAGQLNGHGAGIPARPIRIVPLVVGSFADCVRGRCLPRSCSDLTRLFSAIRKLDAESKDPIFYLISGDLAHIGPKFNTGETLDELLLERSYLHDRALLRHAEAIDLDGYFRLIALEQDARNICGLPPTLTTLEAIRPRSGKLLNYGRYLHPDGYESVSFASMGFYR